MGLRCLRLLVLLAALSASAALLGCEDILPVETIRRCEGGEPPADCTCADTAAQLAEDIGTRAAVCPECQGSSPHRDCENALAAAAGAGGMDGGGAGAAGAEAGSDGGSSGAPASDAGGAGDAGDAGGECVSCPDAQPLCFEGSACVQCLSDRDCDAPATRCELGAHACVECLGHDDCGGNEPRCDVEAHECVACLAGTDCGPAAPVCGDNHRCQPCSDDAPCENRTGTELCDIRASSPTQGECVQCLGHGNCANPTPQCTNGACVACTGDAACAAREGMDVCNTLDDAETEGHCVECTGDTEVAKCEGKACKRSTGTCTDVDLGTLTPCSPCEADSECVTGARCVTQPYGASATLGPYCFFERATNSGCADSVAAVRPYSETRTLESIDGIVTNYCLPITTCKASEDATGNPLSCAYPEDCGEPSMPDGYCIESAHPTAGGKCSYQCDQSYDCPDVGFTSCAGVGAAKFCQP